MKVREMELLVRVAEAGSMTLAARQLELTPAAVSGAVQRIEASLGLRLFERTTRSLTVTEEGRVVIEGCQELVEQWQRLLEDARGHRTDLSGTVHLSAPADTTYQVLHPVVLQVAAEHPGLRVVLDVSDAVQPVHRAAIDIAIRYGALPDSTLVGRKLAEVPNLLVAAPAYLEAHGTPLSPADLAHHRCLTLQVSSTPTTAWELHRGGDVYTVPIDSPLCGDGHLVRLWARAGVGIGSKSVFDVIDDLEAGRLVEVLPDYRGPTKAIHAVLPSRRFQPARVRALHDAITSACRARAARCDAWLRAR